MCVLFVLMETFKFDAIDIYRHHPTVNDRDLRLLCIALKYNDKHHIDANNEFQQIFISLCGN